MIDSSGESLSVQQGVFRTNCMDCLDRTNVVQSLLAHISLQNQLKVSIYIHRDLSLYEQHQFFVYMRWVVGVHSTQEVQFS